MPKPLVAIGFIGTVLDGASGPDRWLRWRPTVALHQQDDLVIDRYEMLADPKEPQQRLVDRVREDIGLVSPETTVTVQPMPLADPWDFGEVYGALHDFATRYDFRPDDEDYLVQMTTDTHVAQICLFLLAESRHLPARLLQLSPPRRGQDGPGDYRMIDLDLSRYDRLAARFSAEREEGTQVLKAGIATRNAAFNALIDQIEAVALRSDAPVLLTGPTGAGKTQLARRIFDLKKTRHRIKGAFVEVNCATLRGDQAMSALFGHRKGAFTGAVSDRPGLLKSADGGMLFLDEIGELGLDEQAMMLRAIEERRFLPVGADGEVESDFLLIAGTNRDLVERVREGAFREDLLARLDLWSFRLPGLAERREDIAPNVEFELQRFAARTGERVGFNKEALARFLSFAESGAARWPGNFRDLGAAITRMATLAPSGRIPEDEVRDEIARLQTRWQTGEQGGDDTLLRGVLDDPGEVDLFDRAQLAAVIRVCRASATLSEAGRTLFAASRARRKSSNDADRLRKYLARFGLTFEELGSGGHS